MAAFYIFKFRHSYFLVISKAKDHLSVDASVRFALPSAKPISLSTSAQEYFIQILLL